MRAQYGSQFGDSPFEDYVHQLSLDASFLDDEAGTVEYGPGWFGRLGKRVIQETDRGFHFIERFATEDLACEFMAEIHNAYADLDELEEELV